jgi:SNF2 family DNA or RNA helicase
LYERGQRVAVRDHHWEVTDVRSARGGTLLELRRLSGGVGPPRTLTVVPSLERHLSILPSQPLRFVIGNPVRLQQLHDALSLTMAHGRGDLVALQHGRIELETYQLIPVLKGLRLPRVRLLIADDVGLGKTIEAGLVMVELARRGRAARVLIACPAGLCDQWVEEMAFRFNLEFLKVDGTKWQQLRRENPASQSPWAAVPLAVSSIDYLKANTGALHQAPPFDLVIIDEAHHVARPFAGQGRTASTERSRLARLLAGRTRELLLLSATPHNGYPESFASLLQLLEPYLAADDGHLDPQVIAPYVVRRLKDKVARGNPPRKVTPGRQVHPIPVRPTAREQEVFRRLRGHSQRTLLALREDGASYQVEAFTLEVLRKRALSSPFALGESLRRRAEALAGSGERISGSSRPRAELIRRYRSDEELDEQTKREAEQLAMTTLAERMGADKFDQERRLIETLIGLVAQIRPEDDAKLSAVKVWLREFHAMHPGERVILFTEFVDTIAYLAEHLGERVLVQVDGTLTLAERRTRLDAFGQTPGAVLLATDAAGEGLNLQEAAHTVLHYELPWNPNRLEQRNGRVDRYGQTEVVQVRYLHLEETRDADILEKLQDKLARIQKDLGSAADVLGLANQRGLVEAILEGEDEDAILRRIDEADAEVRGYLSGSGTLAVLAGESFGPAEQTAVAPAEERAAQLIPGFADYTALVQKVVADEGGTFTGSDPIYRVDPGVRLAIHRGVSEVPFDATFDRAVALEPANKGVHFLTPAHPLVRAVLQRVRARLWESRARDRVAVRVTAGQGEPGYLFTFIARIQGEDGALLEEPLLPVWVGAHSGMSEDQAADQRRFRTPGTSGDGAAWAEEHLAAGFAAATAATSTEARRRLQHRAAALGEELQAQVERLHADLERWRDAERAEVRRSFEQSGAEGPAQLGLFADDPAVGHLATLDEALAVIDATFADRAGQLARAHRVGEVADPDPVGCVLIVPQAVLGGGR